MVDLRNMYVEIKQIWDTEIICCYFVVSRYVQMYVEINKFGTQELFDYTL